MICPKQRYAYYPAAMSACAENTRNDGEYQLRHVKSLCRDTGNITITHWKSNGARKNDVRRKSKTPVASP